MNYYYFQDSGEFVWPLNLFFSTKDDSTFSFLKKNHKRILFALVALYLSYRVSSYLFNLTLSIYRWIRKSPASQNVDHVPPPPPQSFLASLLESTFITIFGLTIGIVAFYAHKQQSSQVIEQLTMVYRRVINEILYHTIGFDFSRSSFNPSEALFLGTLLAGLIIYILWGMVRFLWSHYIFSTALSIIGFFLYAYQFPITSHTAQNYSGSLFVIDRQHQHAYVVPQMIPKILLSITMGYYLLLVLLKSFTLFLKVSIRFLIYSLIATILLNSIASLIREPIVAENLETTFNPEYQFY